MEAFGFSMRIEAEFVVSEAIEDSAHLAALHSGDDTPAPRKPKCP
jgi:hypothetical protein